jgi:polysaccharide biosynthesis transport protein
MSDYAEDELELGDYLAILKRRWAWVLVPLIALPAIAFYLTTIEAARYDATAEVLLSDSAAQDAVGGGSQSTAFRDRILENEISLALSDQASIDIAESLAIAVDDIPDFTVTADATSDVLIFNANSGTANGAATVANVAAETYVNLKQEQAAASITGAVTNLEQRLQELQVEREETRSDLIGLEDALTRATEETRPAAQARVDREASRISGQVALIDAQIGATADSITQLELSGELALGGTARIVSVANPPINSSNAPASRNVVLGLVVGAILGAALALLRENLDDKVRTTEDLERLGLIPLGSIPKARKKLAKSLEMARISLTNPDTAQAQAHQKTQAAVRFLASQHEISNVLITSASQSEGKTTLASNLAIAMARSNVRTVLVDLDLRRPRVHKAYELPQSPGITTVVVDGIDVVGSSTLIEGTNDHLVVVPAGKLPPHAASFITSTAFGETVKELSKLSDFTVFDAPPVLPVADTLTLSQMVGGVILVAYANETKSDDLEAAVDSLKNSGANIMGAVLLGAAERQSGYSYYSAAEDLERM